jgi:hypothetical protein
LGISELSGNGEDPTIIRFEIFLTWQPVFMVSSLGYVGLPSTNQYFSNFVDTILVSTNL